MPKNAGKHFKTTCFYAEGKKKAMLEDEMKRMYVSNIEIDKVKPYQNNPRHNDEAVGQVARSIEEFGFKVPLVIDKNNVIVTGHTRWKAAKKLGLEKVPCIRADDLTDDQVRAFRIADNKVGEIATWDLDKLEIELGDIELDMGAFGLDFEFNELSDDEEEDDDGWYGDERERTNKAYNLNLVDYDNLTNDFWQMPTIKNDRFIPNELIGFNYAKTSKRKDVGVHFYVDDYQFERIWSAPEKYVDVLAEYDCILSPDFSLYMDMPMPMKIWNTYRSRQIGAYYQSKGLRVIPTMSWAEAATFEFCFQGVPKGSVVSVSTIGVKRSADATQTWRAGMQEMIRRIEPTTILVYGGALEFDYGGIDVKYYENQVTENWRERDGNDVVQSDT